ncbi:arrestin domain-containing protein 4 [Xenopus laevis]|uniref:Arrestin domain-containing protein 4 n=2 Tax=Xenopus laevis TaxID=8355 RepID=A0A1L8H111_XENLA|nr:arrestin domain-containing protein 4 [Xenopus laevis]OCT89778.1 hypothetical protein XELAEV_18018391mg [Xenopus laevis]
MCVTVTIVYENEGKYGYCAGDSVTGYVLLEVLRDIRLLRLLLRVCGGAVTCKPGKHLEDAWESFPVGTQYVNEEYDLLTEPAGEILLFPAGKHKIPFRFQLQESPLVTSFAGKYGKVYYQTTAVLKRPSVPPHATHRELRIISPININSPSLYTPVQRSKEVMVGCWFFQSGPISVNAKIGRKGYCNGEAIHIYADIENGSSRLVVPKAAIYQTQSFLLDGKTRTVRQMLATVRGNHIASGSTDSWNGKALKIPPVTPSILECNIIRVEYSLVVSINIPGAKKLKVELPLVVGTVPLNEFNCRNASVARQFSMDMSWLALALPEQPEAPPNYAEIVSEEDLSRDNYSIEEIGEGLHCPPFAVIQEFRFQPPPLYSEVDPHPCPTTDGQNVCFTLGN